LLYVVSVKTLIALPACNDDDEHSLVTLVKPPDPELLDQLRPEPVEPSVWEIDTKPMASPRLVGLVAPRRVPPLDALAERTAPFLLVSRKRAATPPPRRASRYAATMFHAFLFVCATVALALSWLGATRIPPNVFF
jgi:hypothetical protein